MKKILFIVALAYMVACTPARVIETLPKGTTQIQGNFGGPMIEFAGLKIPIPATAIAVNHGITDKTTLSGGIHLTSLAFENYQIDLGVHHQLLKPNGKKPGITGSLQMNVFQSMYHKDFRLWPETQLAGYWKIKSSTVFIQPGAWWELSATKAFQEPQTNRWIPYISIGARFPHKSWNFGLDIRYMGMNLSNQDKIVYYATPFNKGASGVYLSATKTIKKKP
jgi:hypothetical protein